MAPFLKKFLEVKDVKLSRLDQGLKLYIFEQIPITFKNTDYTFHSLNTLNPNTITSIIGKTKMRIIKVQQFCDLFLN